MSHMCQEISFLQMLEVHVSRGCFVPLLLMAMVGRGRGSNIEDEEKLCARLNLCTIILQETPDSTAEAIHNKVISGFRALRQTRVPAAGLESATEGSLQISGGPLSTVPPTPQFFFS
ncbi:hypothetical protein PoB_004418500 [Plakobranchus ocellatus]|uniref:Uncharacterized protein n=1 Tax=Plakobranchus ocellatus TaxID=259542 RepID=A0AAV4BAP7_9GAST|nr:hypothetical protein PoB_004418500 [Plakobranchus ocellatus]